MAANLFDELTIRDDQTLNLGTSKDFKLVYDSVDNRLEIRDTSDAVLLNLTTGGVLSGTSLTSGQWNPTPVGVANVASMANAVGYYWRIGQRVGGHFYVDVTPTAGSSTDTSFRVPLPVSSAFTSTRHAIGSGFHRITGESMGNVRVSADTTDDQMLVTFEAQSTGSHAIGFGFTYTIET